ncbi:unnamed protein product [marine sediment metagenome]|uniref:Uncharacterized protein n=1 Tax=marine sediment metagenome TaxID=412755 RepID=X1CL04_9ZZZZ
MHMSRSNTGTQYIHYSLAGETSSDASHDKGHDGKQILGDTFQ